jgi:hypothetical protein
LLLPKNYAILKPSFCACGGGCDGRWAPKRRRRRCLWTDSSCSERCERRGAHCIAPKDWKNRQCKEEYNYTGIKLFTHYRSAFLFGLCKVSKSVFR